MADHVTRNCFQRTGTLALAPSGVNQKSKPLRMKKSSSLARSGRACSMSRFRSCDSIQLWRCSRVSNRMITVYVAVRPAIGRMSCQSRRPAELLHIGPISFNQSSYPDCCPSRTRWVITTVAPCSVLLKESRSSVKVFSPHCKYTSA